MRLTGIFVAAATPFDAQGDLYIAKIGHNISRWGLTPVAGYVVSGLAGEGDLLCREERIKLWEEVAVTAPEGKTLIAATARESVKETVALTNQAAAVGYQAALVTLPHAYPEMARQPGFQKLFYRSVADQAKIPIIVSNEPQATGVDLSCEFVMQLAQHPNVIAVHQGGSSVETLLELRRLAPPDFPVLAGSALTLYPALALGAAGAIVAFASAAPYICCSMEEAVRTREYQAAHELQDRLAPAAAAVRRFGIAGLKHAMDLRGYYGGPPRLPLPTLADEAKREIEEAFREIRS